MIFGIALTGKKWAKKVSKSDMIKHRPPNRLKRFCPFWGLLKNSNPLSSLLTTFLCLQDATQEALELWPTQDRLWLPATPTPLLQLRWPGPCPALHSLTQENCKLFPLLQPSFLLVGKTVLSCSSAWFKRAWNHHRYICKLLNCYGILNPNYL